MSASPAHPKRMDIVTFAPICLLFLVLAAGPVFAQQEEQGSSEQATPEVLQQGAEVFRTVCAACHGPTGTGTPGVFPPLRDNPRVLDAAYVATVVRDGLSGPIEVNGVNYDGVMPALASLTDDQIEAVAAFVAGGLEVSGGGEPTTPSGAGTVAVTLPTATVASFGLAFLMAAAVAAAVLAPRVLAATDRLTLPWFDAWLKTGVIVAYFVLGTVVLPSLILELNVVTALPRIARDLVGVAVWTVAVGLGLWGLWWAQRRNRV
jgi:mono/diheme cytochrome c family protein